GGAQTLFGVTPDLAAFGKGMANGFPISAVVGRRQYMGRMEDIFFSGTFGGDAIALAAANAVIKKMRRLDVPARLAERGQQLL
ncbi:aminotransferase class III-fold pyridoxal phosphate-dependent enzyme, partial [Aeromonas salmonicida]